MFKLIIADDERTIRESIFASVNWNDLDMQVVGLAMNGSEAYAMVLDELPDIVLTDIRMPGLSGLELIAQIASAMPQVVFVVLSGYDDFRFAQEAMVLGVRYYLLKPCPKAQLIEALQEAKKECYRRQVNDIYHSRQLPEKMGSAVEQAKEFVRKNIGNPNLSLKWIAENILYLNADYLSKQFVRQTGEKFSTFLNRMRIERAKEIIRDSKTLHLYSVAECVGLGNSPQYFSLLFKKATGLTIKEFSEKQDSVK